MPYTPNSWLDGPAGGTPITAATLTHLESQAAAAISYVNGLVVNVNSTMSQSAIQSVLSGVAAGTRVWFAPGTYTLAGPLTVAADSTHIDALKATFIQTTWQQPGFDAVGRNGCLFDIGMVQWSGTRGGQGTSYRGSAGYCSGAGVWINGDRNYVRNLRTSGMPVGVFLSAWNGTSTYDHVGLNNHIGVLESDNANWTLLYTAQQDLIIDDIYGHDDLDDSSGTNPTHVIYGSSTTSFRSTGGQYKSVRGKNLLSGQPVQVKFHDGLRIDSMIGVGCKGLLNVIDSNDLSVGTYRSFGTLANGGQGAITIQRSVTNSQRPKFGPGYLQQASSVDEIVSNLICDGGTFDLMEIDSNHSVSVNPLSTAEIAVRGTGNRLRPKLNSLGAGSVPGVWVGFGETANNTIIESPVVSNTLVGVKVDQSSTGVVVNYDAAAQTVTGSGFFDLASGNVVRSSTVPHATLSTFGDTAVAALLVGSGTVTVGASNNALQVRVTPRRNIAVSSLVWWSTVASGNYDIGIFDDASNAWLWSKGTTAWPAAGKITETVTGVTMFAGRTYRIAFSADNTTGTLRGNIAPTAGLDLRLDGSTATTTVSTAFPLPTSTLVSGSSASTTRTALIVVGGV